MRNSKIPAFSESYSSLQSIGDGINTISDDSIDSLNSEIEDFFTKSGYNKTNARRYGDLEKSGKLVNFAYNRFFKKEEHNSSQDPTASTRDAFFTSYDKSAISDTRDDQITIHLPSGKDSKFRAKKIKYGNHNAMWEILSSHLYRLTGLNAPSNIMMLCDEYEEGKIPDVYVASPLITGYYDLGDFLIDAKIISPFLDSHNITLWEKQTEIVKNINDKVINKEELSGEDKVTRIKALTAIYEMMPQYFHTEIEKSFAASKFIGNWDFANFNLNNIGVRFTLDRDRKVIDLESVFVDFGNSGKIGFKGKYKENSLTHANTEAKQYQEGSKDYDPELGFNPAEKTILDHKIEQISQNNFPATINDAIKSIMLELKDHEERLDEKNKLSAELSDEEISIRKSIISKYFHQISPEFADLNPNKISAATTGLLTISDLPRNLPFFRLFREAIQQKTDSSVTSNYRDYLDSELEIAFRLSLITDEVIERTVQNWYLFEEFPTVFQPNNSQDSVIEKAEDVAQIFKNRRDFLVNSIPQEAVNKWVVQNPLQAIAAQREVELANLRENYSVDPEFEKKYPFIAGEGETIHKKNPTPASPTQISKILSSESFPSSLIISPASSERWTSDESVIALINTENSFANRTNGIAIQNNGTAVILEEIENFNRVTTEKYKSSIEQCQNLIAQIDKSEMSAELKELLKKSSENSLFEITLKSQSELMDFIYKEIPRWSQKLKLEPNNHFLNLSQIKNRYDTQTIIDLTVNPNQSLTSEANQARNELIYQQNETIYAKLSKDLAQLSLNNSVATSPTLTSIKRVHSSPAIFNTQNI